MSVNPARALGLLLLVGWTAAAGNVFGLLHECRMGSAESEPRECYCPHKKAESDRPQLKVDCCTLHGQLDTPAAIVDGTRAAFSPFIPVELPQALAGPEEHALGSPRLWVVPHSQGPPLFLKIRTLLI